MENIELEIEEEKTQEGVKFVLKGRIYSENADRLQNTLQKALNSGQKNIILNMHQVEFLSSAGIRVLLKTYHNANDVGGKLGIERPSQTVSNILSMLSVNNILIE